MMKHTHATRMLNLLSAVSLMAGTGVIAIQGSLYASLSVSVPDGDATLRAAAGVPVQIYQQADAGVQLTIGILLIVLGFFLHGLMRMRSERPVHITVKPAQRKKTWFWMEMRV